MALLGLFYGFTEQINNFWLDSQNGFMIFSIQPTTVSDDHPTWMATGQCICYTLQNWDYV